jgi:quercetin dioxygenase-like cupin family protein
MLQKGFFNETPKEKIKEIMQNEGFSPKLITDKPNFIYEPHKHPETKFLACLEGSMKVIVKGKTYNFSPGDKLVIPGNTIHSGVVSDRGCVYFWSEKLVENYK